MFCECFVQNVAGSGLPHHHQPAAAAEQPPEDAQAGKQVGSTVILCLIGFVVVLLYKKVMGGGGGTFQSSCLLYILYWLCLLNHWISFGSWLCVHWNVCDRILCPDALLLNTAWMKQELLPCIVINLFTLLDTFSPFFFSKRQHLQNRYSLCRCVCLWSSFWWCTFVWVYCIMLEYLVFIHMPGKSYHKCSGLCGCVHVMSLEFTSTSFVLSLSLSPSPPPPSLTVIGILYLSLITLSKSVYKNYIYILLSFLFSYFIVLHMNYPFGVWQLPADKRLQAQSTGPVHCDSEWKAGGACGAAGWEHSQCLGPRPHQEWLDLWSLWSGYHATVCVCVHFFQLCSLNLTIRSYLP